MINRQLGGLSAESLSIQTQDQNIYQVASYKFADNYDEVTRKDDLVILRLSSPILYNSLVDNAVFSSDDPAPGSVVQEVSGNPLTVYDVDITTMTTCQSKWGSNVDATKICISKNGDSTSDVCIS